MIPLFFPAKYEQQAKDFFDAYENVTVVTCPGKHLTDLKDPTNRTCRFCGKRQPEARFNSEAHIIPELLGNKFLVSDFECDNCNHKLGRFDTQLANFIGMYRSLLATDGKNGIPSITSHDGKIEARKEDFFGAKQAVKFGGTSKESAVFQYDKEKDVYRLQYTKQPYRPVDVYRSLLKIGLSLIEEEEVPANALGFEYLRSKKLVKEIKGRFIATIKHVLPINYPQPVIMLFKSKSSESLIPPYTLVLLYGCFMFQIFIPLQKDYLQKLLGKEAVAPVFPPFFDNSGNDQLQYISQQICDLSGLDSKTEEEEIVIKLDPNDVKKRMALDPQTRTSIDAVYDPDSIVSFFLVRDPDFTIKLNQDLGKSE